MPLVSVLLPCYNAAMTLGEALDSLMVQTMSDLEFILVDDGSTDDTLQILQQRAAEDNRFRILSIPHSGIVGALNAGLETCRAPYIARMDSDDRAHPERFARQVEFLERHPGTGVVSCRVEAFPVSQVREGFQIYIEWLNGLLSDEDIRREMFIESPLPHPSVMLRRELFLDSGGYQDHGWPEDYDLWLRLYLKGTGFAKLPEVLLAWREDMGRLTRTDSRYSLENFLRLKAHYLGIGPLADRDAVFIWGAGMTGRRISKHLVRNNVPLVAFIDVDPKKIGRTKRGLPVLSPDELPAQWTKFGKPALLSAVGARRARPLIRQRLTALEMVEGEDYWCVA